MNEKQVRKIVNAILANQVALHFNEELKHTPFYNRSLKNRVNLTIKELLRSEKVFDNILDSAEESMDDVFNSFFEMIDEVCKVPVWESKNVSLVIEAYNKNPSRLEGVVSKILKQ